MKDAFQTRVLALVLAFATLGACVLAGLNLSSESTFLTPSDGIWWIEAHGGLRAEQVPVGSPGERAGIRKGDILQAVDDRPTLRLAPYVRETVRLGVYSRASYSIARELNHTAATAPSYAKLDIQVILEPTDRSAYQPFRLMALVYLSIGLYVLFRRWTAPKSTHFFVFCLVSFVLYTFRYTGQFDALDWIIFWSSIVASGLQPALFLHFAVSFSDTPGAGRHYLRRRALAALLYLPGLFLVGLQIAAIQLWSATEILRHRLDQIAVGYLALYYVIAAVVFSLRYRRTQFPLQRQQLKWLTRGTLLAVIPFTILYVIPYLADWSVPALLVKVSGLSLVLIPLTFSWAIVRYRLMDVDLIFKRGVTYTLATAAIVGLYFGVVGITAEILRSRLQSLGTWGLLAAIITTGLLFDPLKRMIQARVDRLFDRKRFDYRETLVDFGRGLNSQTDLRALLDAIVERLPQTLLVTRVAVFLDANDDGTRRKHPFVLAASHGLHNLKPEDTERLDMGFFEFDHFGAANHLFLENPHQALSLPEPQRQSASRLDLNYYLPCRVANREGVGTRTVAVIGLGRTNDGDFLTSEDMELLESLAGYIGIAIQNAKLYSRLEDKISEFERLKEFHENIVESINIGIFAVDLGGHIGSWNTQMETMYGIRRSEALNQPLSAIFPDDFAARFDSLRDEVGTHTLYKFRVTLPSGEARIANIAIAPLVTRDFVKVGRIILVDDITDRIQLETQLTQAEKLSSIGLLAAGVAHEVNTPLAVISSYTQMLSKHMRDDAKVAPVLEKITQQTFRASEIVNGLLNFSRTSGSEFTSIDLNQLLRDTTTLLEHQFKTAVIRLEVSYDPSLPRIHGNQGKLQQVILNLMLNAKDAMHGVPNAVLRIATGEDSTAGSTKVFATIQDCGGGIEREHLHRIYDPFFTTKVKPQEGQHKGTGLGLAVTYGIMQEHAGKIQVDSEVGVGTTFRLEFPAADARPRQATTVSDPSKESIHA
ncbi:ATP-binding protein [Granulicella sibirica]|uniref:histidine kinase n=1 Tax=Granulicella sibirica TaxID=2479048 RepID=A0A4Q0T174_9BACT|nr:ATP-binding protein [Granulicella sibirica]RXH56090.1 Sensor histidine kinase [Granulicella sibirica]